MKETRLKEVSIAKEQETRNENVSNTQIETAVTEISNGQEKTTTAKASESQESITGIGNESGAKGAQIDVNLENTVDRREEVEEKGENKVRQEPKPPPKPAQRRSGRERKPPAWFDSYQMNQLVARPYDRKLESLNVLFNSGILGELDSEIAHRIINLYHKQISFRNMKNVCFA